MKRREFVQRLGVGSAAAAAALTVGDATGTPNRPNASARESQEHDHGLPVRGSLATATVSFGYWRTDTALPGGLDRYPPPPPMGPPPGNGHQVIPHEVTIRVGGTVNFIIGGLHQIIVYAPGTKPDDINTTLTRPTRGVPPGIQLINDPTNRLYAGLDPSTLHSAFAFPTSPLVDRAEAVQFNHKGRHLVICGVLPHFINDDMYGWVRVVGEESDD